MTKKKAPPPEVEEEPHPEVLSFAEMAQQYEEGIQRQAETVWQYDELPFNITLEEQIFVRSYIIDRNEVAAMRRLGHLHDDASKLKSRAKKYLAKPEVGLAVEFLARRLMEKLDVTAEKVQRQIASVAFFDPREVMTFDNHGAQLLHSRYWTREQAAAIHTIKVGQYGVELKMYDRLKASEMLSKQLGMQPEDGDAAATARRAADETMSQIATIMSRLLPGAKGYIEEKVEERRQRLLEGPAPEDQKLN